MPTLYVSDLDGTLLTPTATLSTYTRATLKRLLESGLPFTVATSRSVSSVGPIFQGVSLPLPVIELNGAYITDLTTGQHLIVNDIATELAIKILKLVQDYDVKPLISSYNGQDDHVYFTHDVNPGIQWYIDDAERNEDGRWHCRTDLTEIFDEQVMRFTLIDTKARLTHLEQALNQHFPGCLDMHLFENPYQPDWYWLTLQDRSATKARGIRELQAFHKLHDHDLTVFGDHNNDISMFQLADVAVATANATLELQQHATEIIGHHSEDSVVKYLESRWSMVNV
ncbi:HAD family hydrolase [Leptolyngbyaceae cyanobacterium CCMR0082]|uniref:HAD family hydrolase n=1 Tax=Adonisia turfae CCMR0082 TaxID=2304604 RepID=A0A6M0S818_9CYAN|nr:HAD family hydrolase [Adonisia turfae]MDV3348952.1 HAD family hydrolase [Leptothoe sp. LEGE 181152]NEZ64569.1 HAD family hydrolase [Adonisia turfae CCMR0082]